MNALQSMIPKYIKVAPLRAGDDYSSLFADEDVPGQTVSWVMAV